MILLIALAQATPGMDHVSHGDRARWDGDRPTAREHYRLAAESEDPSARVMAHLRLIGMSGNYGLLVHGPAIDEALLSAEGEPWDWLALADYYLLLPPSLGGSPEDAERFALAAMPYLPGPALARLYLATGDEEVLLRLAQVEERDGLGDALLVHQGAPAPNPGTWNLGLGFTGSRDLGFGGGLVFVHPDLGLQNWMLQATLFGTTRKVASVGLVIQGPQRVYPTLSGAAQSGPLYRWEGDSFSTTTHELLQLAAGPGVRLGSVQLGVLGRARVDRVQSLGPDWMAGHGASATVSWDHAQGWGASRRGFGAYAGVDWSAGYPHLGTTAQAQGYWPMLRGVGAARVYGSVEWMDEAPFFRLPSAGGADLHRGARTWRYRAPWIVAADVEQRWMLTRVIEGVVFVDGAWVADDGPHPGAGLGLRLVLPPEHLNVIRLDVAISDSGWGLWSGFGETF